MLLKKIKISFIIILLFSSVSLYAGEFLNTLFHLDLAVMFAYPYGDIIDLEENSVIKNEKDENGVITTKQRRHYDYAFSINLDIAPFNPLILGTESHALKFGIRTGYRFHFLQQEISILAEDETTESFGGELLSFQTFSIGPVIHYSPSVEILGFNGDYSSNTGFTFFILYAWITKGSIKTTPAYTEYWTERTNSSDLTDDEKSANITYFEEASNSSEIGGHKIDIGFGTEIAICSVNMGMNVFYSMLFLQFKNKVYEDLPLNNRLTEICFEMYTGIPVEWFIPTGNN